ncbi:MAG: hypothetical protein EHM24_29240 [Acidobacteria bacterium]|nr:MAG: hypothetical protein EHM24_29240 [Acidobacteriota bacterium]
MAARTRRCSGCRRRAIGERGSGDQDRAGGRRRAVGGRQSRRRAEGGRRTHSRRRAEGGRRRETQTLNDARPGASNARARKV